MKSKILLVILLIVFMTGCSTLGTYFPQEDNTDLDTNETSELEDMDSFESILEDDEDLILELEDENVDETEDFSNELLFAITVDEGETVVLNMEAEDPDGDEITYTYTEPLNENGEWETVVGDAGTYMASVSASDGILTTTETIMIIVESVNQAPSIDCPTSLSVQEGDLIEIACAFSDADGEQVDYEVTGFMSSLTYQTTFEDAGEYEVNVVATDGIQSSKVVIDLIIENSNRAPVVSFSVDELIVTEKDLVDLDYEVVDADGDDVTVQFQEPLNGVGKWETAVGDAGDYTLVIVLNDGTTTVEAELSLRVNAFNIAPVINIDSELTFQENDLITLPLEVTDANGDEVTITISGFMTDLTYQSTYDDAGEYEVTITATDGLNEVSEIVTLIIENVNRPPQFIING